MAATATYKCKCCGEPFVARTADRKRGWAKFCSKKCKAVRQSARIGNPVTNYRGSGVDRETYVHHAHKHGGVPHFDGRGGYIGSSFNEAELAGGGYGDSDPNDGAAVGSGKW